MGAGETCAQVPIQGKTAVVHHPKVIGQAFRLFSDEPFYLRPQLQGNGDVPETLRPIHRMEKPGITEKFRSTPRLEQIVDFPEMIQQGSLAVAAGVGSMVGQEL